MGPRALEIFEFFQCRDRLYMSESDVYRRQILMYIDCPQAEKGNIFYKSFNKTYIHHGQCFVFSNLCNTCMTFLHDLN